MVWAVILAAGESRRMGSPKLLLPFGDTTVVETVVDAVAAAGITRTLVVLGDRAEGVRQALKGRPAEFVENADYRRGMLSSVQCGLRGLPSDASAALIVLADQPGISAAAIRTILRAAESSAKGIAVPVHQGKRGHPLFVSLRYKEEIFGLDPAVGLRQLLKLHSEDILEIEVPEDALLEDMDTPEDYRRMKRGSPRGQA
jgi:molybdenum cofactor cytidylyltransferase